MSGFVSWRNFWIFWLGGLAVFISLVMSGGPLMNEVAPGGILDHQSAGTAARVNEIQQSWAAAGLLDYAKWGMIGDLIFIGLYTIGGIIGGRLLWQDAWSPSLKKLGLVLIVTYFLFGLTDYIETICQLVQLTNFAGSDSLASTAATARPVKIASWIIGTIGMIVALIWYRQQKSRGDHQQ